MECLTVNNSQATVKSRDPVIILFIYIYIYIFQIFRKCLILQNSYLWNVLTVKFDGRVFHFFENLLIKKHPKGFFVKLLNIKAGASVFTTFGKP